MKRSPEDSFGYIKIHKINNKQDNITSKNSFKDEGHKPSLSERIKDKVQNLMTPKNSSQIFLKTATDVANAKKEIFEALENKNLARIKELVEKYHIDVNSKDDDGFSVLHHAVCKGLKEIVDFLIETGADVNIINNKASSVTPLYYAVSFRKIEIIENLLKAGADIDVKTSEGNTILHEAAYVGNVKAIKLLLENPEGKKLINLKNDLFWTAIDSAIESYNNEVIKILLEHKAIIGKSLLHAALIGNFEACEILINAGAQVNAVDELGRNSLHQAYLGIAKDYSDDYSLIVLLENNGAINVEDNAGNFPKDLLLGESSY